MLASRSSLLLSACLAALATSAFANSVTIIALSGQPAPGPSAGNYATIYQPDFGRSGAVVFRADVSNPAGGGPEALFTNANGPTRMFARSAVAAPEANGATYFNIGVTTIISDAGRIAFEPQLSPTPITTTPPAVLYVGDPDALRLVLRPGAAAPDGQTFAPFGPTAVNDLDDVAIYAQLQPGGLFAAAVVSASGNARIIAKQGDAVAEISPTATMVGPFFVTRLTNDGTATFRTKISESASAPASDAILIARANQSPRLLAYRGGVAPLMPATTQVISLGEYSSNASGQVAFVAGLSVPAGTGVLGSALYVGNASATRLAARDGDAAPVPTPGMTYASFASPAINDAGQLAFLANLAGPDEGDPLSTGIFLGAQDGAMPIAVTGDRIRDAAGLQPKLFILNRPALNERGQVAFMASLSGAGVTGDTNRALISFDPSAGLQILAREGKPFDLGNGVIKTISTVDYEDRVQFAGLGNDGRAVVRLLFTDNTVGIFAIAVPEPTTLTGLVAGMMLLRRRRSPA